MSFQIYDVVMFHYPCQDGLTSAWVAHHHNPSIKLYPTTYGKHIDVEEFYNKNLLICDFTPSQETLDKLESVCASIQILDHHITAQKLLENKSYAHFNIDMSGAGMTWKWLFPETEIPSFVLMVQDRDLWKWEIPNSKEFTSGLMSMFQTLKDDDFETLFSMFDEMLNIPEKISFYIELGKITTAITKRKVREIGDEHSQTISKFSFQDKEYRICCVNCSYDLVSEIGNYLCEKDGIDFAVLWRYHTPTKKFHFSLRSKGDVDVSEIAASLGGGGHKNAAGVVSLSPSPFLFGI